MERRCYETVVVFTPDLTEQEFDEQINWVKELIEKNEGRVLKVEKWGKRRLAYEIEKKKEGYYVLLLFWGSPSTVENIERQYRINQKVLRYLSVKRKDKECQQQDTEQE